MPGSREAGVPGCRVGVLINVERFGLSVALVALVSTETLAALAIKIYLCCVRRSFLLILCLLVCILPALGQECDSLIWPGVTSDGKKVLLFNNPVKTKSEGPLTVSVFGVISDKTVSLALTVSNRDWFNRCMDRGNITFQFSDGTNLKLVNEYEPNCEAITAVHFSKAKGNLNSLRALTTKTLTSIKVPALDNLPMIEFSIEEALALTNHLKCLASYIDNEDIQEEPIQELPEVTFEEGPDSVKKKFVRPATQYPPRFVGGEDALRTYINSKIIYPVNAIKMGIDGTVKVVFTVKESGEVSDVRIQNGIGSECDIEAFRVVKAMPRWEPAVYDNFDVAATASVMIAFNARTKRAYYLTPNVSEKSFVVAESSPEFVGGYEAMMKFIHSTIKWPMAVLKEKREGTIQLNFVVSKDGTIKDIKVIKGVHPLLDAAAIDVVRAMPRWKAGKQNGKTVDIRYNLPIRFGIATKTSR
jgi:TonB family protein